MTTPLKDVLTRAQGWPQEDQAELAELANLIESRRRGVYAPSADELAAIDDADESGIATEQNVKAAFDAFRRP